MPHLFTNRPRRHTPGQGTADARTHFRWETANAILYKIGGVVFIIGSVLFFPALERYADVGAWTFFFGSLLYLIVTGHDLMEVRQHWLGTSDHDLWTVLEAASAVSYLTGTLLFTAGSIFFLSTIGWTTIAAWCFVIGSLLFVAGAGVNVLQVITARSAITLQLMNLTAVSFVVGSVLFTVASIPYLWDVAAPVDRRQIDAFLAWQYLIGSLLFFLGGVFNYWRAYVVMWETCGTGGCDKRPRA